MNHPASHCPVCRAALPADTKQTLCPKCLLREGLAATADVGVTTIMGGQNPDRPKPPGAGQTIRYFGDYELLEEIGRGGMGVIYKAKQCNLNRVVAVKMILTGALASESEIRRFHTEAEAAANLQHPNIVAIHEVGLNDGLHYFSMDFVEGANLAQTLARRRFTPLEIAKCVRQLAEAIHYAHQRGTLHRDLKPHNVLIDATGTPRITDFGLARKLESDGGLTRTGAVLGSPAYMSPEQAAGRHDQVGPASDVYSLGAILYEMLTGKAPFRGESVMATLREVIETPPAPPSKLSPGVSRDLETICLKCLEKDPGQRYATARMLAEELERFMNGEPVQARPAGVARRSWSWLQRHPWALAGGTSLLMLFTALLAFGLWQKIQFLGWKASHPNDAFDYQPFFARWLGQATMNGRILLGWLIGLVYLSGPLLFADFARRKNRQFRFTATRLAAYSVAGVLELTACLAMALMLVKAVVWNEVPWDVSAVAGVCLLTIVSFPFWWFGANLFWYARREKRYLEASPAMEPSPAETAQPKTSWVTTVLLTIYRRRNQVVAILGLLVATALWRRAAAGNTRAFEVAEAFTWMLFAVLFACGLAGKFWRSHHATRHFYLAGALLVGAAAGGSAADYAYRGNLWSLGLLPVLTAVALCWALVKLNRVPAIINEDDFQPGQNGSLLWTELHPKQFIIFALALGGWINAKCGFLLGSQPANGWAVLAMMLAPQAIHEYRRSQGQARQARAVILAALATVLVIAFPPPPRFLLYGTPLLLVLGLIALKLQLRWEAQHRRQADGADGAQR